MSYPHIQHVCNIARRQRVLYVVNSTHEVRHHLEAVAALGIKGSEVRRSNGCERATFAEGGSIIFATTRTLDRTRGRTFDHVFTDSHHYLDSPDFRRAIAPCFAGSAGGERYSVIG